MSFSSVVTVNSIRLERPRIRSFFRFLFLYFSLEDGKARGVFKKNLLKICYKFRRMPRDTVVLKRKSTLVNSVIETDILKLVGRTILLEILFWQPVQKKKKLLIVRSGIKLKYLFSSSAFRLMLRTCLESRRKKSFLWSEGAMGEVPPLGGVGKSLRICQSFAEILKKYTYFCSYFLVLINF